MKPRVFAPAIASGVLLWLAFFPFDLGFLGFAALAPWLTLARAPVSRRRRYFAAYLGGFTFFALATNWVRVAHPMMYLSWLGLALVMPLFWLAALALIRRLDRLGVPLALSVPVAWVALEYARMHFPTGFTFMKGVGAYQMIGFGWYFLGYTQHAFTPLIQIADLGGVYAVSFVVAAANGALAGLVTRRPTPLPEGKGETSNEEPRTLEARGGSFSLVPSWEGGHAGVGFALALLGAGVGYGYWRLDHQPFADGPVVAALQGNLSQGDKMGDPKGLLTSYTDLHFRAVQYDRAGKKFFGPSPDLVVWPETCCPMDWCAVAPDARLDAAPDGFRRHLHESQDFFLGHAWAAPVLFGLTGLEWDGSRVWKYNSAALVTPAPRHRLWQPGDPEIAPSAATGRYDKMHLVPFGEYVPLGDELPFMKWFTPYKHDYACRPGERWTKFPLDVRGRALTFACLICYEDSDPYLARQYVGPEPVDFLVNISNDGWFDGTEEHEQHLAICRFRAVEARRSIVRAVNMGVSGVIDPDGRVVALPDPDWRKSKKVDAIVTAAVPLDTRGSTYAAWGDWVPAGCWLVALAGAAVGLVRRRV